MRWLPSRAHDNGLFVIFSNGVGIDDDEVRTGNAMIIDPYGRIIKKINLNESGYIVSSLPNKTKKTLYSIIGDFLFFGVLMLSVLILLLIRMNRKNIA